jgi:hypothetical protein
VKHFAAILLLALALGSILSPCAKVLARVVVVEESCNTTAKSCCQAPAATEEAAAPPLSGCCGHSGQGDDHGACSSFCHCNCCGYVATVSFIVYPQFQPAVAAHQVQPLYTPPCSFEYAAGVWQPPRKA